MEKDECPDCGSELSASGPINGPETGEEYRCVNESCEYYEQRFYD